MARPPITTRQGKGTPLTWAEGDANFTNLQQASNPDGGVTGQILAKTSNTDYDYAWVNPGSFQGIQGVQGSAGYIGADGNQGIQGIQGTAGTIGVNGAQGTQGVQGWAGTLGTQGSQGIQGVQGRQGIQGNTGSGTQGSQGVQGRQGIQGTQGTTGSQGTQGTAGGYAYSYSPITNPSIGGWYPTMGGFAFHTTNNQVWIHQNSNANLDLYNLLNRFLTLNTTIRGQIVIQQPDGDTTVFEVTGGLYYSSINVFVLNVNRVGAPVLGVSSFQARITFGFAGDQGVQGIQGTQGVQGTQGIQGAVGQGFKIARSYTSVSNLSADYPPSGVQTGEFAIIETGNNQDPENSRLYLWDGFNWAYITDLSGAVGIQGTTGTQGAQGDQGIQGIQGVQGVQGDQGLTGQQGTQGVQGVQGVQGLQGVQGDWGLQGYQGRQGIQGVQGIQGDQGVQGLDGAYAAQGIQGTQGTTGTIGTQGLQGTQGTQGVSEIGAFLFNSYTIIGGGGVPSNGSIVLDDSIWSDVTQIRVSENNASGQNNNINRIFLQARLLWSGIITNKFKLILSINDGTNTYSYGVEELTDNGTYWTLDVKELASNRSTNQGFVIARFPFGIDATITGFQGIQGVQGIQGRQGTQGTQGVQGRQGIQGTMPNLLAVDSNIVPNANVTYDLGTPTNRWRSLYVSTNTIYVGDFALTVDQGNLLIDGNEQIGPPGPQGVQGVIGVQGAQGPEGIPGATGSTGGSGAQGIQGVQGLTGQNFKISKSYNSVAELSADTTPTGILAGEFAIISSTPSDEDNSKIYLWTGQAYQYVNDISGFSGLQGTDGPQGLQGAIGLQGFDGYNGVQGNQGLQGTMGFDGSQGVQGLQGQIGFNGLDGSQGIQGVQGTLGYSTNLFDYTIDTSASSGDPGIGGIRYNTGSTQTRNTVTFTQNNSPVIGASQESKYGSGHYYLDGTTSISTSSGSRLLTTEPFTIEGWFAPTANNTNALGDRFWYNHNVNTPGGLMIGISRQNVKFRPGNGSDDIDWTVDNSTSVYKHYAITRSGSTISLYVDGVFQGSGQYSFNNSNTAPLYIGLSPGVSGEYTYLGRMDEIRVSNTVRYTSNFTPPTQPFVNDGNTLYLLHFNGDFLDDNTAYADNTQSTQIYISKTTSRGQVATNYLKLLKLGTKFLIQDKANVSNYQIWRMTGAINDSGTYLGLPSTLVESNGTGTTGFANNLNIDFGLDTGVQGVQGTQGVQGIQGLQGASGPTTSTSTTQPGVASVGDQWFNPSTQILYVYTVSGWVQVTADDLTF